MSLKFSIVIPVYNVAPYLRECLDSVLAQTYLDWEAICVDDGSTDGSGMILDEYEGRSVRFRVIHQANSGVSAARNAALNMATGEWICFVDSDDVVSPDWLTKWYELIVKNPETGAIRGEYTRFEERGTPEFDRNTCSVKCVMGPCDGANIGRMLHYRYLYNWMYAFRRKVIADVRFRDYICGEDRVYTFACLRRVKQLLLTDFVFYGYRARSLSYSHAGIRTYRGWFDELRYRAYFLDRLTELGFVPDLSHADWLVPFLKSGYIQGLWPYRGKEFKSLWGQYCAVLPKLMRCTILPMKDRRYYTFLNTFTWYPVAKLWTMTLGDVRRCVPEWIRRAYRRLRHHGEYAARNVV